VDIVKIAFARVHGREPNRVHGKTTDPDKDGRVAEETEVKAMKTSFSSSAFYFVVGFLRRKPC
jgi:hypothetical protein